MYHKFMWQVEKFPVETMSLNLLKVEIHFIDILQGSWAEEILILILNTTHNRPYYSLELDKIIDLKILFVILKKLQWMTFY